MIVVDSSIRVDDFNGRVTLETDALDGLLGEKQIVTMLGPAMAERSASNYRELRRLGVTVRKTIDVMIGTYCIARALPLLYSDRDFDPMVQYLGLRSAGRAAH